MKRLGILVAALVASCNTSNADTEQATLGPLAFEVPAQWTRTNYEPSGARSAMWTPVPDENTRKESVTVIRSVAHVDHDQLTGDGLASLLAGAQGTLRGARVSKVRPLRTRRGYTGASIDVSFQPGEGPVRYRRVHAVLVEPATSDVIHVLYTAASPDDKLTAFYTVLESIHEGG